MISVLFDIGGTKTRVSVTRDKKRFIEPIIFPTPKNFERGMADLRKAGLALARGERIGRVIGGIIGKRDKTKSRQVAGSHLSRWIGRPLRQAIEHAFHAPLTIENDSALVALGEAVYGAGRGYDIVAYMTVSTGVGGARVVDGRIDRSAYGFDPGHQFIDLSSKVHCSCGRRGDLESLVGGQSVKRQFGKNPWEIKQRAVWIKLSRIVGYSLNNIAMLWSPEVIVLGGSMFKQPGLLLPEIRKTYNGLKDLPWKISVVRGRLGDVGGLYGALALSKLPEKR